jgi:hypothetical protein
MRPWAAFAGIVPLPPQRLFDDTVFSTVLASGLVKDNWWGCDILLGVTVPSISTDGNVLVVGAAKGPKVKRVGRRQGWGKVGIAGRSRRAAWLLQSWS